MTKIKMLSRSTLLILVALFLAVPIIFCGCGAKKNCIELKNAFKTTYVRGEMIDLEGGAIDYYNEDGEKSTVALNLGMISGFSTATAGKREMVITYTKDNQDYTTIVAYTVLEDVAANVVYVSTRTLTAAEKAAYGMSGVSGDCALFMAFQNAAGAKSVATGFRAPGEPFTLEQLQAIHATPLTRTIKTAGVEYSAQQLDDGVVVSTVTVKDITENGFTCVINNNGTIVTLTMVKAVG